MTWFSQEAAQFIVNGPSDIYIDHCVELKDLGPLNYFLRIEEPCCLIGLFLCQHKYVLDIMFENGTLGAKLTSFYIE